MLRILEIAAGVIYQQIYNYYSLLLGKWSKHKTAKQANGSLRKSVVVK